MLLAHPSRGLQMVWLSVLVMACGGAEAQYGATSRLPATAPTAANQVAPLTASAVQSTESRAHRADVRYEAGLISVNANNSSLNQILREISRQTGMKITGGVRDERVFGHYGPATADAILETLIDGNQTNLLLRHTAADGPAELILTPRAGGPSPPNPNAAGFDGPDEDDRPPQPQPIQPQPIQPLPLQQQPVQAPTVQQVPAAGLTANPGSVPPSIPQPANNVLGNPSTVSPSARTLPVTNSVSTDSLPTPSTTTQVNQGIVDAPNQTTAPVPADAGSTSTGAKTPDDIYQQLMKLKQQQTAPK